LYVKHREDHDLDFAREEGSDGKGDPLNVHEFHLTRSVRIQGDQYVKTPCIIISASGWSRRPGVAPSCDVAGYAQCGHPGGVFRRRAHAAALYRRRKIAKLYGQDVPVDRGDRGYAAFPRTPERASCCGWLTALLGHQADLSDPRRTGPPAQALQAAMLGEFQWKAAVADIWIPCQWVIVPRKAANYFAQVRKLFEASPVYTGKTTRGVGG